MHIGTPLAEIGQRAGLPEPAHHARSANRGGRRFVGEPLERGQVDRLGRKPQHRVVGRRLEIGDQRSQRIEARFGIAPEKMSQRGEAMLLDRIDLFLGKLGRRAMLRHARQRAESAVALVPARTSGDLRHLGRQQTAHADAVELGQPGKGDVIDIEIEPHADRVGRDDVVDLAALEERDLLVAGFGTECSHHHCRPAAKPPQHLGDGVDLVGAEGHDRAARRQARELARPDMRQGGKPRPVRYLRFGDQLAHQRFERGRAEQHRFLTAAGVQQPVGKDMAALAIGTDLRFVKRHECRPGSVARHGFGGAAHIARILGFDPFFTRDQRDGIIALDRPDPVVDLARQQPQRKAHAAARMRDHALDREMRLAGVRGPEDRLDRAALHAP